MSTINHTQLQQSNLVANDFSWIPFLDSMEGAGLSRRLWAEVMSEMVGLDPKLQVTINDLMI